MWKFVYATCSYQQLPLETINKVLKVLKRGNLHPLMRQYASTVLCKLYREVTSSEHKLQIRKELMDLIGGDQQIDLNIHVPVILTLGY